MLCENPHMTSSPTKPPADPKKKKKKKKQKFSDVMAEATQGTPETAEQHRQKISRNLGGGTFSKVDQI
jgi:hypothetical protein